MNIYGVVITCGNVNGGTNEFSFPVTASNETIAKQVAQELYWQLTDIKNIEVNYICKA